LAPLQRRPTGLFAVAVAQQAEADVFLSPYKGFRFLERSHQYPAVLNLQFTNQAIFNPVAHIGS